MQQVYETDSENGNISENFSYSNTEDSNKKIQDISEYYENKREGVDFSKTQINIVKQLVNKCEGKTNEDYFSKDKFNCKICNNKSINKESEPYVILSCNHIFHIKCLAETHFKDIYSYAVIDNDYFDNRKCTVCNSKIQMEEIMYLHSKFLSNTKTLIEKHQVSIENLESQLKSIKTELRICYDYKHKLQKEREKSKQIVSILTTMI
jgi:hypothetical protein